MQVGGQSRLRRECAPVGERSRFPASRRQSRLRKGRLCETDDSQSNRCSVGQAVFVVVRLSLRALSPRGQRNKIEIRSPRNEGQEFALLPLRVAYRPDEQGSAFERHLTPQADAHHVPHRIRAGGLSFKRPGGRRGKFGGRHRYGGGPNGLPFRVDRSGPNFILQPAHRRPFVGNDIGRGRRLMLAPREGFDAVLQPGGDLVARRAVDRAPRNGEAPVGGVHGDSGRRGERLDDIDCGRWGGRGGRRWRRRRRIPGARDGGHRREAKRGGRQPKTRGAPRPPRSTTICFRQ